MGFSWVATEVLTGAIIADLPDLDVDKVSRTLGSYTAATGTLPLPTAPPNWERATLEGATNLILLADNPDDPSHGIPIWGGMITKPVRSHGDTVPISVTTLEAYLDRRFVGDKVYTAAGQSDIIADLITSYIATGSNGGIPIRVQYATPGSGVLRDRTYKDQDDMTVYSAMQNLMGVIGGPEWTIEWEWQHSPERITPVLLVGARIGVSAPDGLGPAATFEMPGPVTQFSNPRDYSSGKGANDVMAYSSGQGDVRPQSPRQVIADPERPTFEHRYSPSSSIIDVDTLTGYAMKGVAALAGGTQSLSMSAVAENAPRLGVDWSIGDDIGYKIGGLDENGRDTVPGFPGGIEAVARAIGWELTLGNTPIITPILDGV